MNYIPQVAKMLGVELYEEFTLKYNNGFINKSKFRFTETQMECWDGMPVRTHFNSKSIDLLYRFKSDMLFKSKEEAETKGRARYKELQEEYKQAMEDNE